MKYFFTGVPLRVGIHIRPLTTHIFFVFGCGSVMREFWNNIDWSDLQRNNTADKADTMKIWTLQNHTQQYMWLVEQDVAYIQHYFYV